jgi:hypothetical protein
MRVVARLASVKLAFLSWLNTTVGQGTEEIWMHARRSLCKALESDEPHMGPAQA